MHWVYLLRCSDGCLYVGETDDLERRMASHINGRSIFTASRRPIELVHSEVYANRHLALTRERQLKRWKRAKKEALIRGHLDTLRRL